MVEQEEPDVLMTGPFVWIIEEQKFPAEVAMKKLSIGESRP